MKKQAVDPSACPAPRSEEPWRSIRLDIEFARAVLAECDMPRTDDAESALTSALARLSDLRAELLASRPGDAAQDARPLRRYAQELKRVGEKVAREWRQGGEAANADIIKVAHVLERMAAQDAPPAPQGWQPIARIEHDEHANVLLFWPAPGRSPEVVGHWSALHGCWRLGFEERPGEPTHGMPLPAPPVSEDTK